MAAIIQSSISGKPTITGASREDLRAGDVVTLMAFDTNNTSYNWSLTAPPAPDGTASSATLSSTTGVGPITFTVDNEGAYLVSLTTDAGITATESTQFVRLRFQTVFGDLRLVAPGERRDNTGVVPVDISAIGWANDQNFNLQRLLGLVKPLSASGRVFTVDANRGVDNANTPNDPTIAEGFADFSSINEAIQAAAALSPAPTATQPAIVKIQPGLYEEDLVMVPNVHLLGMGAPIAFQASNGVEVRTTTAEHLAPVTNNADVIFVCGLNLVNNIASSNAALRKTGDGTLYLDRCRIEQNGSSVTQGPAVHHTDGFIRTVETAMISINVASDTNLAWLQDTNGSEADILRSVVSGPSGMDLDPANLGTISCTLHDTQIVSDRPLSGTAFALRTNAISLDIRRCQVLAPFGTSRAILVHPDQSPRLSDLTVSMEYTNLLGVGTTEYLPLANIEYDVTGITGTTTLRLSSCSYGAVNVIGGTLDNNDAFTRGETIVYDDTLTSLGTTNVQTTLDLLAGIVSQQGQGASSLSLDTAYDGIVDITVPTFGAGSGRTIVADQGAVVIQGATSPIVEPPVAGANGFLQVEGSVQVGAVSAPEVDIDPNPFGVGPKVTGGALVFPDLGVTPPRSIPAFIVEAASTGSPLFHNYNLLLRTPSIQQGSRGEVGRAILRAGDSLVGGVTPPDAGSVYLQAGHGFDLTGNPGNIFLAPGDNANLADPGRVTLADPEAATAATLQANGAFVGGQGGNITFAIEGVGQQTALISNVDTLADVQTKLNALEGISCTVNPANDPLTITSLATGPNSDIYFAQDDQGGLLNTALGDFAVGSGATFTPGAWPNTIGMGCTDSDEITIFGDVNITGTLTAGATGASGPFVLNKSVTITNADSPYNVVDDDHLILVDTTGGPVTVNLPTSVSGAITDRQVIIKDSAFNAAINNITISGGAGNIDNAPSFVLNLNATSLTVVCNGLTGASTIWFVV